MKTLTSALALVLAFVFTGVADAQTTRKVPDGWKVYHRGNSGRPGQKRNYVPYMSPKDMTRTAYYRTRYNYSPKPRLKKNGPAQQAPKKQAPKKQPKFDVQKFNEQAAWRSYQKYKNYRPQPSINQRSNNFSNEPGWVNKRAWKTRTNNGVMGEDAKRFLRERGRTPSTQPGYRPTTQPTRQPWVNKRVRGNNGLGNGYDPQPRGNPKPNDTYDRIKRFESRRGNGSNYRGGGNSGKWTNPRIKRKK